MASLFLLEPGAQGAHTLRGNSGIAHVRVGNMHVALTRPNAWQVSQPDLSRTHEQAD